MAMYVYSTRGEPVGFLYETFIHDFDGTPLGRIIGSRVHRFDGSYAGEWFKEMVVAKPGLAPRPMPAVAPPPRRSPPGRGMRRRVVVDYGYADAFDRLCDPAAGEAVSEAAE